MKIILRKCVLALAEQDFKFEYFINLPRPFFVLGNDREGFCSLIYSFPELCAEKKTI